jgi:MoxR-like ATPase
MQHSLSEQAPPSLGFASTALLAQDLMASGTAALIWGPPGIGKSAMAAQIARDTGRTLITLIGSNCEPSDMGGLPIVDAVVDDGGATTHTLRRIPLDEIASCTGPNHILFCDELTGVTPAVRQPMLRLILEKVAGSIHLHPDTWIMAAANHPDHCPAAQELDAAFGNRFGQIDMLPTRGEVCSYMATIGENGTPLRSAGLDWAATCQAEPRILQLTPPDESIQEGKPFASPRMIEKGLTGWVLTLANGRDVEIQSAILSACWGDRVAGLFLGVLKYRKHLPTEDQILADPAGCKLPEKPQYQIAAVGLLARVAERDSNAAWIYADRLDDEFSMAATRTLLGITPTRGKSPHKKAGAAAKRRCLAGVTKAIKGTN